MTDFVGLSRAARDLPGADTHDRLWSAWFALPVWHFLKASSPSGFLPSSTFVHGQRCTLGFTTAIAAESYARNTRHPDPVSPVMSLVPDSAVRFIPQLRSYGVVGLVVDTGPDAFYTPLETLFPMLQRYRPAPVGMYPTPLPVAPPPPQQQQPAGPPVLTVDSLLRLPAWHVVTTRDDPNLPELAVRGADLVARIYSSEQALVRLGSPRPPTAVMPPDRVLAMLVDLELVPLVRFDDHLEVELVDLKLRAHSL